jgi:hypothetical protein
MRVRLFFVLFKKLNFTSNIKAVGEAINSIKFKRYQVNTLFS